ncbi:hypothetical protein Pmani_018032 [Petrolisthes manimaculis]|uniref:Uncharacterized protein n=1 Tax=Petrolisthes manimaculis TaxID=1843537 RepID=A0AAE1PL91_9EUCA|nr:hypothetical protein Pmani_018032 [Petrolisthes manimaculis]
MDPNITNTTNNNTNNINTTNNNTQHILQNPPTPPTTPTPTTSTPSTKPIITPNQPTNQPANQPHPQNIIVTNDWSTNQGPSIPLTPPHALTTNHHANPCSCMPSKPRPHIPRGGALYTTQLKA